MRIQVLSKACPIVVAAAWVLLGAYSASSAERIEAVHGKQYKLTRRHGPWMILAANFREPPPERKTKGMSPQEAADELVFELRKKGIPAYTYAQGDTQDEIETIDRVGRPRHRKITSQYGSIAVLAGNYASAEDRVGQKTLAYIKKFQPQYLTGVEKSDGFLQKLKNGGIYRVTPGHPGPLSGAFLTINPMLSPEEVRRTEGNPLLKKLNSGGDCSILENPGKYTLIVATFRGRSNITQTGTEKSESLLKSFKVTGALDDAAMNAWSLAKAMRTERNLQAFVFHDRHQSVVTVGSFDSPNDPRIAQTAELYRAKVKQMPNSKQEIMTAENFASPLNPKPGEPQKTWIFDPTPTLMEIPRL